MESQLERISSVECRVRVEIPWKDIAPKLDRKLRDLRQKARVRGFRPGKVPPPLIERMYGKSVREELVRDLVQETFPTAVSQHRARPLTEPVLESHTFEKEQPFVYAARFEVPPALEPTNYEGIAVRRRPAVLDDSKVDAELERKRQELTELRPIPEEERGQVAQVGDIWTLDVDGTLGDEAVSRTDVKLEVGAEQGEFIPGIAAALADVRRDEVGQTKQIRFVPPSDRIRPEYRGKEAVLTVGLRNVQVKHVPELDDEFARDTGEAEDIEELKAKIRDRVLEEDRNEAERDARRRLVEELLARNPFESAPSMITREVAAQVEMAKRQLAQQGMTLERMGTNERRFADELRPQATFNVKAFLLLDAIGKKEGIDVSDERFEQELQTMAEESGQNLARLRAQMEKNGQLIVMRAQLREEKILDFLMEKAEVTEAPDPALDEQIEQATAKITETGKGSEKGSRRKRRKPKAESSEADQADASENVAESPADDK